MNVLVDSSVWIDYFRGAMTPETDALHGLLGSGSVLVGDLIMSEVLQGARSTSDFNALHNALSKFPCINVVDRDSAISSAHHFRTLRGQGVTVRKTIDCLIASRCIVDGLRLLHNERDFDVFEDRLGLKVYRDFPAQ